MNKDLPVDQQIEYITERLDSCRLHIRNLGNNLFEAETDQEKRRLRGRIAGAKAAENRWREILGIVSEDTESFSQPKRRKIE